MSLGPGSRLDAYELISPLGSGGMGEVWLATEVRLGRQVALKLLRAEFARDPARVSRFEQEARAASALKHPNVSTIHALGETSDGQHPIRLSGGRADRHPELWCVLYEMTAGNVDGDAVRRESEAVGRRRSMLALPLLLQSRYACCR